MLPVEVAGIWTLFVCVLLLHGTIGSYHFVAAEHAFDVNEAAIQGPGRQETVKSTQLASVPSVWYDHRRTTAAPVATGPPLLANDTSPTTTSTSDALECKVPQLVGDWQRGRKYRFPVAEAQGAMVGDKFLIVSGFLNGFRWVTRKTYTLDTSKAITTWVPRDRLPVKKGLTHAGFVVVGTRFYMCGGYIGGSPGPHTDKCLVMDLSKRRTRQWSTLAPLPDGGRGGGGLVYDTKRNALIFAAGAQRPNANNRTVTVDYNTTWMYELDNPESGWKKKASIPFRGNHLSFVTARDASGAERHFFAGGQLEENEANGNSVEHFEYNATDDTWIVRKPMTIPRGHASSSTRAVGCGYIMAAGSTNGGARLTDVSYYDIPTDAWSSIGNVPTPINTPVCDIAGDMLYCESGFDAKWFSHKIQILF